MDLRLTHLSEIEFADIIALHNDPRVIRHMPLAGGIFDESECKKWVESKESQWEENGYGPWAILINGAFAGWGGLQLEKGETELALVLSPEYWGYGKAIYQKIVKIAFDVLGIESVTVLLPPSRVRANGMLRLGFQADGQVQISETLFSRYRLWAPKSAATDYGPQRRNSRGYQWSDLSPESWTTGSCGVDLRRTRVRYCTRSRRRSGAWGVRRDVGTRRS